MSNKGIVRLTREKLHEIFQFDDSVSITNIVYDPVRETLSVILASEEPTNFTGEKHEGSSIQQFELY